MVTDLKTRPFDGPGDASLPDAVKALPDKARDIWVAAFNNAWENYDPETSQQKDQESHANAIAWGAVNRKFKKNDDGEWVARAYLQGSFEAPFTSVKRADDGLVTWKATISDDGVDRYATRMTIDLHDDFIKNAGTRGMPCLSIGHFNRLAPIGVATALYRDGRRLKAEGVFFTEDAIAERFGFSIDDLARDLARAAAAAAQEEMKVGPQQRLIRTSIGFKPMVGGLTEEDLGVFAYTRGWLPEITMTTSAGNSRADFSAEQRSGDMTKRISPDFMEQDASNIVGEALAKKLRERLDQLQGDSAQRSDEDPLDLIFRSMEMAERASVKAHKGRAKETGEWNGPAAVKRARKHSSEGNTGESDDMKWGTYRRFFAVYDPDAEETFDAYGFIHHDIDGDGMFVDLAGVLAAGTAASGARSGQENKDAQKHLGPHYGQFDRTPPWERSNDRMIDRLEDVDDLRIMAAAGYVDDAEVTRALATIGEDLEAKTITDFTDVESMDLDTEKQLLVVRVMDREIAWGKGLAFDIPVVKRAGRRLAGAKLNQLSGALAALTEAAGKIGELVEWAQTNEAGDDGGDRSYEPQEIDPDASLLERVHDGRPEADDSLVEAMGYQDRVDLLYRATFTLSDIIVANMAPEEEELSLEDRMQNVQGALNEYAQVVNSLLVDAFGGGRSGPADNSGEMLNDGKGQRGVKPKGTDKGAVNPGGEPPGPPDLQAFDEAAQRLRQLALDGAPTTELQAALVSEAEALDAIHREEEDPDVSEVEDDMLQRIGGVEVAIAGLQSGMEELLQRSETPAAPATTSARMQPRRRGLPPGPQGPATTVPGSAEAADEAVKRPQIKRVKIADAVKASVDSRFPTVYP